jgi:hypothetical protein
MAGLGGRSVAPYTQDMPKRSSKRMDINELAFHLVAKTTGQLPPDEPKPMTPIQAAASAMGKVGGPKGGKARAAALTPEQRAEIARKAALARWKNRTKSPKTNHPHPARASRQHE